MDEPLILFAWTLGGTVAFGVLGALFGGLSGWISWRNGSASGSVVGRRVADALARLFETEMSDPQRGALIGAADGGFFLGLLGTLVGVIAARSGHAPQSWLVPLFLITLALVTGALMFGVLALGLIRLRLRAVVGASLGGVLGALSGGWFLGVLHIVPGAVAGILLGTLAAFMVSR
jgi:hypothetical protein